LCAEPISPDSREALDNEASALVAAAGEHAKYVEAAAAALAALRV
jgi:hypothetical protein